MIRAAETKRRRRSVRKVYTDFLPPLSPAAYESLKASIAENGVEVPVVEDDQGNLIDGTYREQACEELGIPCPKIIRRFAKEYEKHELALRLNCERRQLAPDGKDELIAAYLRKDPHIADNTLAGVLGDTSKNTVAKVRCRLERSQEIPVLSKLRGKDGKLRRRNYRIVANTTKEVEVARKAIKDLPDSCDGKILDTTTAARRARRHVQRQVRAAREVKPLGDSDIQLHHCRFQELEQVASLSPASVHLILTDIPYGEAFLDQLPELAALARRALVEGGILAAYCGQIVLNKVIRILDDYLTYRWMKASAWTSHANVIHPLQITSTWEPVLIYSKGDWKRRGRWRDMSQSVGGEKNWHPWQKPLGDIEDLVRYLSDPGDLVIDPCGGSFTTAVACRNLGRRFIGCDVDEECVRTGWERLSEGKA